MRACAYILVASLTMLVVALSVYDETGEQERADLTYANPSGIHTLDPARMSWTQDLRIALNIWEGLTTYDPVTLEPIAGVALHPPAVSDDGLVYTFTIRDEARWSNGDPVTAADFVRGWRRGMEPGTATDYAFLFTDHIQGADKYVRWRRAGVAALTALSRLRDGWGIDGEDVEALKRHPIWSEIPGQSELELDRQRVADRLASLDVDWAPLYDRVFHNHVEQLDATFNDVGMKAPSPKTLVVTLTSPCAYFPDLTAFPTLSPSHESIGRLRERHNGAPITAEGLVVYDPQWTKPDYHHNGYPGLITNGPYRLARWRFKRRARLEVNPFFHAADSIACRTVDMVVYQDLNAAIMAYEAGDLDFLPAMDVSYDHEIARLAATGERPDFHACTLLATYFLNFNCVSETVNGKVNPFTDPRVRKAFALAVDKEAIVNRLLKRGDRVAGSFVPPGVIAGYSPPEGVACDIAEARRLLAEANHPDGDGLPAIELLHTPRDGWICQAMARMWEESLGVEIDLTSKETKTFGEDKANRRYMIARANWYADYNDPTTFLNCLVTGNGNNDSGYSNPRYDALLAKADKTTDPKERFRLLARAERILVEDDLPILVLLHYTTPIAIKPYVSGLSPNPRLLFPFRYVSVTP